MITSAIKILIVDDEPPIRKLLRVGLVTEGYAVIEAADAREAIERVVEDRPDLIVLDLGLPDMPGHDLLEKWRNGQLGLPILILSSRTDEAGIVRALELGADDYVTKPFGMRELAARIRVALRHRLQQQGERPIFQAGELTVDLVKRIVKVADREVKLSPKEYDILRILVQHAGKVLTHQHLLKEVWGGSTDVQYLRVYVRQLRQKIERSPDQPEYILTETGVGYRLREAEQAAITGS
ncbi:two-component system KDP operon response regulator KdpE [Pseudochelatococcus lubricantis]|uniref:Two-component system KDP operon response regulator KdpE n=1 Tax=Pseudochelatococcus lubricantis TaxID=1538102 RepID=A0ABX0V5P2_9HYPH|nr:response regulator transcription factor [Pseudochelatococcus lubricantis]NIJ59819.1 two-component system KDP operon response regulator KdpE [Pseudochelatococcus lubricantis]